MLKDFIKVEKDKSLFTPEKRVNSSLAKLKNLKTISLPEATKEVFRVILEYSSAKDEDIKIGLKNSIGFIGLDNIHPSKEWKAKMLIPSKKTLSILESKAVEYEKLIEKEKELECKTAEEYQFVREHKVLVHSILNNILQDRYAAEFVQDDGNQVIRKGSN